MHNKQKTLKMAELGILLALVVVLQSISSIGIVTICLCLVPITLGAMICHQTQDSTQAKAYPELSVFTFTFHNLVYLID